LAILDLLLGRRLANRDFESRKIGALEGIPAMGLDALGSSAYGPEAALAIVAPLGLAGSSDLAWVMVPIIALLLVLCAAYWQTVQAYPNNGGGYIVAKDNLGTGTGLLAAAALMVDYVLNVAVGISAGVGVLVSAYPALHPHILALCLGILGLLTIANLRGTLDAGRLFALPTYLFVASFGVIFAIGIWKAIEAGGRPEPLVAPPALAHVAEASSFWLLLRAFAAGCTAMTGVEAVSNGMSAFRDPAVKYGHRTLAAIVLILGLFLAAIAYLVGAYHVGAMEQSREGYRTALSQLAGAIVGNGMLYYAATGALLCVLCLSANTSFVDFPRLCRMVAQDGYLPKPFAVAGHRLVFSAGILYLAACSSLLLIVFGGITDRLIPLFALGAFLTFTLSQWGMARRCRRAARAAQEPRQRRRQHFQSRLYAAGASITGIAFGIILIAKFREGAWMVVLVMPCVLLLLNMIHRYYAEIAAQMRDPAPLALGDIRPPVVLVVSEDWSKLTDKAITFALGMSRDVFAVHLTRLSGPESDEDLTLQDQWRRDVEQPAQAAGLAPPRLVVLPTQHRTLHEPIGRLIAELAAQFPERRIAVLIPEIVKQHWFQFLLHTHRARRLKAKLLKHGGPRLTIISVPWYLEEPRAEITSDVGQPARPRRVSQA
jgi:amino acid transporter